MIQVCMGKRIFTFTLLFLFALSSLCLAEETTSRTLYAESMFAQSQAKALAIHVKTRYKDCPSLSSYADAQNKYIKAASRFKDFKIQAEIYWSVSGNTNGTQYIEAQKLTLTDTNDFITYAKKLLSQDPPSEHALLPVKRLKNKLTPKPKLGPKISESDLSKIDSDAHDISEKDLALWDEMKMIWDNPSSDQEIKNTKLKAYLETYDWPDWSAVEKSDLPTTPKM